MSIIQKINDCFRKGWIERKKHSRVLEGAFALRYDTQERRWERLRTFDGTKISSFEEATAVNAEDFKHAQDQAHDDEENVGSLMRWRIFKFVFVLVLLIGLSFYFGTLSEKPGNWHWVGMFIVLAFLYYRAFRLIIVLAYWRLWIQCLLAHLATISGTVAGSSVLFKWEGLVCPDSDPLVEWIDAFYFSVVTWTTLGFGDFQPASTAARLMAMFLSVSGYAQLGLLITIFTKFLKELPIADDPRGLNRPR